LRTNLSAKVALSQQESCAGQDPDSKTDTDTGEGADTDTVAPDRATIY